MPFRAPHKGVHYVLWCLFMWLCTSINYWLFHTLNFCYGIWTGLRVFHQHLVPASPGSTALPTWMGNVFSGNVYVCLSPFTPHMSILYVGVQPCPLCLHLGLLWLICQVLVHYLISYTEGIVKFLHVVIHPLCCLRLLVICVWVCKHWLLNIFHLCNMVIDGHWLPWQVGLNWVSIPLIICGFKWCDRIFVRHHVERSILRMLSNTYWKQYSI